MQNIATPNLLNKDIDLIGLGNAIVDIIVNVDDEFLDKKDDILELKGFGDKTYDKLAGKIKEREVDA